MSEEEKKESNKPAKKKVSAKKKTRAVEKKTKTTPLKKDVKTQKETKKVSKNISSKKKSTKKTSTEKPKREIKPANKVVEKNVPTVEAKTTESKPTAHEKKINRLWWLLFFSLLLNLFFVFSAQVLNQHPFNQTPYPITQEFRPGISLSPPTQEPTIEAQHQEMAPSVTSLATISTLSDNVEITTKEGVEYIFKNEKTWIPYDGQPFEVVVLVDEQREDDEVSKGIEVLKKTIHPAIIPSYIDINSEKGQEMAQRFGIKITPSFFFGEGFEELEINGILISQDSDVATYVNKKGDLSFIDYEFFGENNLSFLPYETVNPNPQNNEPSLGSGPVQVIEYASFEDPDSFVLNQEYLSVLQELVRSNTITYVIKDRITDQTPVPTVLAHQAANSVLNYVDTNAYLLYRDLVYKNQDQWLGKTPEESQDGLTRLAAQLNIDIKPIWNPTQTEAFVQEIKEDASEAKSYNMMTGKALFINGQKIPLTSPEDLRNQILEMAQ